MNDATGPPSSQRLCSWASATSPSKSAARALANASRGVFGRRAHRASSGVALPALARSARFASPAARAAACARSTFVRVS